MMGAPAALYSSSPARADTGFVKVISPGNEALIATMLKGELPPGCKLSAAAIDRTRVTATYSCGGADSILELRHPQDGAGAAVTTAKFALVPKGPVPPALVEAVAAHVRANEKEWRWVSAEAPGLGVVAPPPAAGVIAAPTETSGMTPEEADAFVAAVKQYREGKLNEAFDALYVLARTQPRHGVLGMLVASLASTSPTRERVKRLTDEADAHPDDTLAQFAAGVGSHYCGHLNGKTRAEKLELYRQTIKYLERTRPKFDFEPRVYVYLAISHFRLGEDKEAQALIEKAIPLATNDPDVYYCRAEIFQNANTKRSIADIQTYLKMVDTLHAQGVPISETKHARVRKMLAYLEEVDRGARKPESDDALFDPLPGADPTGVNNPGAGSPVAGGAPASAPAGTPTPLPAKAAALPDQPPPPNRVFGSPALFGGAALGVTALALAFYFATRRRAK